MRMLKNNPGFPLKESKRELKKACEEYWGGKSDKFHLEQTVQHLRYQNWQLQLQAGIDLIPCNDFSYYDHVLDMSLLLGVIPSRYTPILTDIKGNTELDLYFAMARGYQKDGLDIKAMEMIKWFDTDFHYVVPEFTADQSFKLFSNKLFSEYTFAKQLLGEKAKPVIIGPVSYLLLGKEKENGFQKIELIKQLVPVYIEILNKLKSLGAVWVQLEEPFLALAFTSAEKQAFEWAYNEIKKKCFGIKILLTTYFEGLRDNIEFATKLQNEALHIDLVRAPKHLECLS
ncbi:hypothetical protein [Solitalea lacus]|uniref:hypothetical protein n=1 Tax=Solitalea lacus TaxID=2911172 RepID=UPI001EDA8CE8|nr:hypothetical protein [Solitalea lacus]UKJ05794.1 hypothetical protein L2B55_09555 [Solitalea lacus]